MLSDIHIYFWQINYWIELTITRIIHLLTHMRIHIKTTSTLLFINADWLCEVSIHLPAEINAGWELIQINIFWCANYSELRIEWPSSFGMLIKCKDVIFHSNIIIIIINICIALFFEFGVTQTADESVIF